MGFVAQSREELDPENTVFEEISEGEEYLDVGGGRKVNLRGYVAAVCVTCTFTL